MLHRTLRAPRVLIISILCRMNLFVFQLLENPFFRGVVHSQIGWTDFKSSKKSLYLFFFQILRIFSDFQDFFRFFPNLFPEFFLGVRGFYE